MIKQKIIRLREQGFSYREIVKKLKVSYGTVQRASSNVGMSKSGLERYSKLNGLTKIIIPKIALNENKVRIISNLLFDGAVYKDNYYHYSIMYVNKSDELMKQFITDIELVYNLRPSSFEIYGSYQRVKYISKMVYEDLKKYMACYSTSDINCLIPSVIFEGNISFKLIILRAFWENEGSIAANGKLSADLKNFKVIEQLSLLHTQFGLQHGISKYWKNGWAFKLFLHRSKENYSRFIHLKLFSKSIVSKGYNEGRKKINVLNEFFEKNFS